MESSLDPVHHLRELERAEAAPYVGHDPAPRWFAPTFGLLLAAYVGAFGLWEHRISFIVAMVLLAAGTGVFLGWITTRFGALAMPGRGNPPPEILSEYRRYGLGLLVVVAAVAAVWWGAGVAAAAGTTFVLVTGGMAWYQVRYERAARTVRDRLA